MKDDDLNSFLKLIGDKIETQLNDIDYLFNNTICLVSHLGKIQI